MSRTIADLQEATIIDDQDEILFYQNSTKKTKKVKRGNFFNSRGIVVKGKVIDPEYGDVGKKSADAEFAAGIAEATAEGAQETADGKNRIFYQATAPSNPTGEYVLKENDIWFKIDEGYKTHKWNGSSWEAYQSDGDTVLSGLNVGKLTSGFISSKVLELSDSGAYIQSNNFVETWVNNKLYKVTREIPSDQTKVKVEQNDGTFKIYQCNTEHTSASSGDFPGPDSGKWTDITSSFPTRTVTVAPGVEKAMPDCGFRIVGNGFAEFHAMKIRGAIIANVGYFGDNLNAARIDDLGLILGNEGRIKSAGIGYNGTDFTSTAGTGGFFLGNTQEEGNDPAYQFFIGDPSANNLWWDGANLKVNAKVVGIGTGGLADPDAEYGITIGSQYGIRRSVNNGTLTLSGGSENGIQRGAQIDLAGTQLNTSASDTGNGILSLQAGYNSAYNFNGPRDGSIEFRTSLAVDNGDGADLGVLRMRIDLDGQVNIFAGQTVAGDAPDGGAGKLVVDTEVVVREGATRNIVLKKLDGNGMIYLRDSGDSVTVTLDGGAGEITASSYNSTSSKRFKKKIKNLKNGLNLVTSLRPVTFDWKKKEKKDDIGLIAEEVYQILPSVVKLDEDNLPCAIDYSKLTPILIQAVKELYTEIHVLKSKIKL